MFIEINNTMLNTIYIVSLQQISDDGYKIIYTLMNGTEIIEEFSSEQDMDTKAQKVKNSIHSESDLSEE